MRSGTVGASLALALAAPALAGAALGVAIKDTTVSNGAKICEHFDCQTVLATYT